MEILVLEIESEFLIDTNHAAFYQFKYKAKCNVFA